MRQNSYKSKLVPIPHIISFLMDQIGPVATAPAIPVANPTTLLVASIGAANVLSSAIKTTPL